MVARYCEVHSVKTAPLKSGTGCILRASSGDERIFMSAAEAY